MSAFHPLRLHTGRSGTPERTVIGAVVVIVQHHERPPLTHTPV